MREIEHDPNEPPPDRSKSPWGLLALIVPSLWIGNIWLGTVDFVSAMGGVGTGVVLTAWAIEVTGNRVPSWMRSKPPGR